MIDAPRSTSAWVTVAAVVASVLVFVADIAWFPPGYSVAALHLIPLGLALFQRSHWVPFVLAGLASTLVLLGHFLSPPGIDPNAVLFNRGVGAITPWVFAAVIGKMLRVRTSVELAEAWQRAGAVVSARLVGEQTVVATADQACAGLVETLRADTAVMYRLEGATLTRCGGHALDPSQTAEKIAVGQGVVGQVAADQRPRVLSDLDERHVPLTFASGSVRPRHVIVAPIHSGRRLLAVVEIGFLRDARSFDHELRFIKEASEPISSAMRAAEYHGRVQTLLEQTQQQAEALQAQQEELRVSNEELEEQGRVLRESQSRLELQQADLEQSNVQLEEQTQTLQRQRAQLLQTQQSLREQAVALEAASRYKSEFLANMSHELRTPLNSSLILSKLLGDNKAGTLTDEQVRWAEAIHSANNDLLALINDILDLAKIEAGHVELEPAAVSLTDLVDRLQTIFAPMATQKGLQFTVDLADDAPAELVTDRQRLQQVLTNLLGNAIKFTDSGEIRLRIAPAAAPGTLAFEVHDTGIGIPEERQQAVFEAFRQADGSTSRRFGGTGLGLSIARELALRLGGDIALRSTPGHGSVFTLTVATQLEITAAPPTSPPATQSAAAESRMSTLTPGNRPIATGTMPALPAAGPAPPPRIERTGRERLVLIVEDDLRFSNVLCELVREMDFDCATASTASDALRLAHELQPNGVLLDVGLPDQSGIGVLERLKRDPDTRHIPVHVVSGYDRAHAALELGAIGFVQKPASRDELIAVIEQLQDRLQRSVRRLLIVEDDAALREHLSLLLTAESVAITAVGSMGEALRALEQESFDCVVLDLTLPDGSGYDLLESMAGSEAFAFPPVIVYTGRALSADEEQRLRKYSQSIIIKGARSPERLLDEVTLFLHSVESRLPAEQQRMLKQARERDAILEERNILLAEDDVRNVFALSSVFEPLGARLVIARNGREALEALDRESSIDLVLMDVMMPEMDGLTAMRAIRERPGCAKLPIIALTAKAMAHDRDECLAAGANDYIAKPIDVDKLVSLCRVWMPK